MRSRVTPARVLEPEISARAEGWARRSTTLALV
jgi:hypothetical protein